MAQSRLIVGALIASALVVAFYTATVLLLATHLC